MKPTYQRVRTIKEACPQCHTILSGNNSPAMPWCCPCGVWQYNKKTGEYDILEAFDPILKDTVEFAEINDPKNFNIKL